MAEEDPKDLMSTHLRLRPDASIEQLPVDAGFWGRIAEGALGSFHNEYLVSCHSFSEDWQTWEMHPMGDEIVCLLSGAVVFELEEPGGVRSVALDDSGAFVLVPRGTWHTARTAGPATMLFITAGEGTRHRPVECARHED